VKVLNKIIQDEKFVIESRNDEKKSDKGKILIYIQSQCQCIFCLCAIFVYVCVHASMFSVFLVNLVIYCVLFTNELMTCKLSHVFLLIKINLLSFLDLLIATFYYTSVFLRFSLPSACIRSIDCFFLFLSRRFFFFMINLVECGLVSLMSFALLLSQLNILLHYFIELFFSA